MDHSRQDRFNRIAAELGYNFDGEIKIGGNYASVVADGRTHYVSGQVPRVGDTVMVTGRVGTEVTLAQAQRAAKVCALRALVLLGRALGGLDQIDQVLRVGVFVQSASDFCAQSEVADAASDLLLEVLGPSGRHARTSVGVYQLPKNASVELEMVVRSREAAHAG